mgnify:FL=1
MTKRANRALALMLCLALLAGAAVYAAEPVWSEKCLTDVDGQANTEFFEFSQNWRNNIDPGKQECWLPGETARFGFRGTGLRVYASVNTQEIGGVLTSLVNDRVTIRIDGGEEQLLRTAPGEYAVDISGNTAVFEVTGLAQGYHEAVITCGASTTQFTSFYFWSTQVADGAMVPRPVWGEVVRADLDGAANSSVFDFSEYWRNSIVPGAQECWLNGQNVRFSFKGTGLRVLAQINTQDVTGDGILDSCVNNNVTISIDGGAPQPLSLVASSRLYQEDAVVYQVAGLSDGGHEAVITCGDYTAPAISNSFYFYGVQISGGTMLPCPSWGEVVRADLDGEANSSVFTFSEYWRNSIVPGAQECWLNGQNVRFSFKGTGLRVLAQINTQDVTGDGVLDSCVNNNVTISIDGGEPQLLSLVASSRLYQEDAIVYQILGLTDEAHEAVITCGDYTAPAISNSFYFYGVQIADGALLAQASWSEMFPAVDRNLVPTPHYSYTGTTWNTFVSGEDKLMHSGAAGESLDFAFTGEGVRVWMCVNVQNGESLNNDEVYLSIDGGEPQKLNMWVAAAPGAIANVLEVRGLTPGYHTATLTSRGRDSRWGSQTFFSGVQIANGTMEEPPQWTDIIRALSDAKVQNPDFTYSGGAWTPYTDNLCMRSTTAGATVDFDFDGTGVKIFANVNIQNGEALNNDEIWVSVDGGEPQKADLWKDNLVGINTVVLEALNLAPGSHHVTIQNRDRQDPHGNEFYFYGVSIQNGDIADIRGQIESLRVVTPPTALYYGDRTEIDLRGLVLEANGRADYTLSPLPSTVEILSGAVEENGAYHLSAQSPDRVQEIVCSYKGVSFTLPLIYYSVDSIEVSTLPKTDYLCRDDHFTTSGGELTIRLGGDSIADKPQARELLLVPMIRTAFPGSPVLGEELTVECSYLGKDFSYAVRFVPEEGDVDRDGDLDPDDLRLLIRFLLGDPAAVLTNDAQNAAELDGMDGLTMDDATVLRGMIERGDSSRRRTAAMLQPELPSEEELTPGADGVIALSARNVRHIGRTYRDEQTGGTYFNWSCSGFEFRFRGTKAEARLRGNTIFSSQDSYPLVQVFIDGADEPSRVIQLSGSDSWVTLAEGLSDGVHTVKLLKQNQTAYSSALCTGLRLSGKLLAPGGAKRLGIQIIGDSIAAGMFNETPGLAETEYVLAEENSYNTEYAILARNLGADFTIFANSGAAVNVSSGPVRKDVQVGRNVTELYRYTDLFWGYEGLNETDNTRADLILINLGTNDLGYMGASEARKAAYVEAYVELLRYLRVRYPEAMIVCTAGVIEIEPITLVRQAVEIVNSQDGDLNTFAFQERQLTHAGHPRVEDNRALAAELEAFIRSKLS